MTQLPPVVPTQEDRATWLRDLLLYSIQFHIWSDAKPEDVQRVIDSLADGDEYDSNVAALVQMPKWCAQGEAQDAVDRALATSPASKGGEVDALREAATGWRCYHCSETFTDDRCARLHFGRDEDSAPACQIKAGAEQGLLSALRDAEYAAADAQQALANECTESARAYYAQATRHNQALRNAEELGYERGLADGRALLTPTESAGERIREACAQAAYKWWDGEPEDAEELRTVIRAVPLAASPTTPSASGAGESLSDGEIYSRASFDSADHKRGFLEGLNVRLATPRAEQTGGDGI